MDPERRQSRRVTRSAGPNTLQGFSSYQALHGRLVVLGAQYRSGSGVAVPAGMRGTSCLCRVCRPSLIWSSICKLGRDVTPGHIWYRDSLSHLISSASGDSQFQAAVLTERRM